MGEKSFKNSFFKQKVARAACSEQLNEMKGRTKGSGKTCRLPVLVQGSMVDSKSHPRKCTTQELCEELPACLPGTAEPRDMKANSHLYVGLLNTFLFSTQQVCVLCCHP